MRHILACIDFSDVTDAILRHVGELAAAHGTRVTLLHVVPQEPDYVGYGPSLGPAVVREALGEKLRSEERQLTEASQKLRELGTDSEALLLIGPIIPTIIEQAHDREVDLVVLGSHGHGALHHLLLGSVAEGLLRKRIAPLLIVPAGVETSSG